METGTFAKTRLTKLTKLRLAMSGLENLLLLMVAVVTILGVIAISSRIQRSHIQNLLGPQIQTVEKPAQHP